MSKNSYDIGIRPDAIQGGKPLVSNDISLPEVGPGATFHETVIVDQSGNVFNDHITIKNPGSGKTHIW